MSVISFDDWKKKRAQRDTFTTSGDLREDISLKEAYGFDLCSFIIEEIGSGDADPSYLATLWDDLLLLIESLPHEHAYHYFQAFIAFRERETDQFKHSFDLFLQSESQLHPQIPDIDWWVEHFLWIFIPPYPKFYDTCSDLFLHYWPSCAMVWICKALEQNEQTTASMDLSLKYLHLALLAEPENSLAHYLLGSLYFENKQWQNAYINFQKASSSELYNSDASFLFDLAWSAEKSHDIEKALLYYQQCIDAEETYPCALNNLGCLKMYRGENEEAFHIFSHAIALSIDGNMPVYNALTALERQEKWPEAIAFIKRYKDFFETNMDTEIERLTLLQKTIELFPPEFRKQLPSIQLRDPNSDSATRIADQIHDEITANKPMFNRNLAVYHDQNGYGRNYYLLNAGKIDLLCYDIDDQTLLVIRTIDLLLGESDMIDIAQQVKIVQQKLAKPNQAVIGLIVCMDVHPLIEPLLQHDPFSRLLIYRFHAQFDSVQ